MKLRIRRPRYADVVATVALVFALSGAAYAVATVAPPNSVDTAAIQDGAVTRPKLHGNAVSTANVVDDSLTGADIASGSIGNSELGVDSVQAVQIADGSIDGGEIIDNSLGGVDIADGSLTGADIASESISLADIVGANVSGSISFTLGANSCSTLSFGVSGAQVGQAVLLTYTGTTTLPTGVLMTPMRVVSAGSIVSGACNVKSTSITVSGLGVRIITFG